MYLISLKLGDETYEGSGETSFQALQSVKKPAKLMGKGIVTITQGDKKKVRVLMPVQLKRLFYPSAQFYQARNLELGMK